MLWILDFVRFFYSQTLSTGFSHIHLLWTIILCMNIHFVDNLQEVL